MWWSAVLLAAGLANTAGEPRTTYRGYRVYDVTVANASQAGLLRRLAANGGYELWNEDDTRGPLQLQAAPAAAARLESQLAANWLPYSVRIADVQRMIDAQTSENRRRAAARRPADCQVHNATALDGFRLDVYHTFGEIEAFVVALAAHHPDHMRTEVIGRTHEGRPLRLVRLRQDAAAPADKPIMWLDCGIHAREWVSPAVCLYVLAQLVGASRHWLRRYDWHVLPVVNPDGYVYTHTHDRLWRKNRRPGHYCTGVDLNRNFAARWGTFGVTFYECGTTFPGYRSFSEHESRAVRDAVLRDRRRLAAFNSLHSYGQMWLIPYGNSLIASPHVRQQRRVGRRATRAMKAVNGVAYRYGISSRLLYLDSGTSTDWAYKAGVTHSVAIEARDRGRYGFLLPSRFILPTAREVWAGLLTQAALLAR